METTWIRKVTKVHWAGVFLDRTEPVMPLHQRSDTARRLFVRPLSLPRRSCCGPIHFAARFPSSRNDDALALFERGGNCCPGINPRSVLTEKCVIEDRRSQADGSAVASFVATENPTLAENRVVLLAGNLLRHLKDHLNQRELR